MSVKIAERILRWLGVLTTADRDWVMNERIEILESDVAILMKNQTKRIFAEGSPPGIAVGEPRIESDTTST
jgi:hypothetical protein